MANIIGKKYDIDNLGTALETRKGPVPVSYTHLTLPTNREV